MTSLVSVLLIHFTEYTIPCQKVQYINNLVYNSMSKNDCFAVLFCVFVGGEIVNGTTV